MQASKILVLALSIFVSFSPAAFAQAPAASGETVELTYNGDVELRALADYVSNRLNVKILIDDGLATQKVSLNAPGEVPIESLVPLLQSALRMKGFALIDAEVDGWKRIVASSKVLEFSAPNFEEGTTQATTRGPVTRVFKIENADPNEVDTTIKPFLTADGANSIVVLAARFLIVTDYRENLMRIEKLIKLIDQPKNPAEITYVEVKNVSAAKLADHLTKLSEARTRALGKSEEEPTGLEILVEDRTNQLILIGDVALVKEFIELAKSFDKPLDTVTRTYTVEFATTEQVAKYAESIRNSMTIPPAYEANVEGSILVVTTTEDVHRQIRLLIDRIDTPQAAPENSPIRFYKIKNVPVQNILQTLQGIAQNGAGTFGNNRSGDRNTTNGLASPRDRISGAVSGPNVPFSGGLAGSVGSFAPPLPSAYRPAEREEIDPIATSQPGFLEELGRLVQDDPRGQQSFLPFQAQVTADTSTNTLIIVAEPEVQKIYKSLIDALDKRSPQVLIEAKVVVINTSDNYSLGIDVSGGDRTDPAKLFTFTSFGLSSVNPANGALSVLPSLGLNGVLVDPDTADLVVQALATHDRARVLSSPRLLVNDNAEGTLTSVAEVPFTSVNASQTVATTSFAGFAEAGTTITVQPTISEDEYLQLDYVITLNSFTAAGSAGVPPPRQTDEVASQVTVPDGYTIIVGGLNQMNRSDSIDGLPFVERIPVIRRLFSAETSMARQSSLFVFLKPTILRDDKFRDLRFLSSQDLGASGEPADYPKSDILEILR
jgi:type II secretory pathway component GspD/PulD (secretin)